MTTKLEFAVDGTNAETLKNGARKIIKQLKPNWNHDELQFKVYTDGITNQLIGVWWKDRDCQLLIRVYGKMTDMFIDRCAEKNSFEILHAAGCCPELYGVFENGLCYGYTVGEPTTPSLITQEPVWRSVAKEMATLHRIEVADKEHPMLFTKMHKFLSLIPDKFTDPQKEARVEKSSYTKGALGKEMEVMEKVVSGLSCPIVFSHNDILLANVIWNSAKGSASFIDYEYAAPNYQAFDISNHFNEFAGVDEVDYSRYPNEAFQRTWLRDYLSHYQKCDKSQIGEEEVTRWYVWANKFSLTSHLFWGTWAILQAHYSKIDFDFLGYGIIRLNEYSRRKEECLNMKI